MAYFNKHKGVKRHLYHGDKKQKKKKSINYKQEINPVRKKYIEERPTTKITISDYEKALHFLNVRGKKCHNWVSVSEFEKRELAGVV